MGGTEWDWSLLHTRCRREACRLVVNPHDAEEAAQEALVRAWRKRHTCRTPATPVPWVLQIARNEAYRLNGRRGDGAAVQTAVREGDAAPDPSEEELAERLDLRRALARLTSEDRVLLFLRYDEDLKQNSIAEMLDTPEGTIKVKLHRARERLRTYLKDEPEGDHPPQ